MKIQEKSFDKSAKKQVAQKSSQSVIANVLSTSQGKEKYEGLIDQGSVSQIDLICPSSIDTRNADFILVDGTYIATILVITYPYERPAAWLSDIINFGEGVEVNMYYEPLDKAKIVKDITYMIGETGAKRKAIGENQSDVDIVDTSLGHAKYMRQQMNINSEDPYYLYILVSVYADSKEKLEDRLKSVESKLGSKDIISKRSDFRHESGFIACLPLHQLSPDLKKATRRNALTKGIASTYPFCSFEFCDDNGILVGINEHNNSLVIVDIFNTALYKNANAVILGTSGAGKTFLIQLLALRLRLQNIPVMIIAPLKGHEFKKACLAIGGQYIKVSPASGDCINIMEIRKSTLELEFEDEDFENASKPKEESLLMSKIQKLHIFFSLVFPDMATEEREYLDEKLIAVYERNGINFDNESLYSDECSQTFTLERKFKEMPVLGDLYDILESDPKSQRLALLLKRLVKGSLKAFNQQTNVDLNNKYTVADISELKGDLLPIGMFIVVDLFWDKIKEDRTQKKVIFLDELWKLIGTSGNKLTAEFVLEIFKIIRGYGGSAVGGTQDIADFFALEGGKYGKGIINNSKLKFVLQLEEDEAEALRKVLKLSDEEMAKVTTFARGHGLFYAGVNHIAIEFRSSPEEKNLITTDRAELEEIKRRKKERISSGLDEQDDLVESEVE